MNRNEHNQNNQLVRGDSFGELLFLGKTGENGRTKITFDCRMLRERFGGVGELLVKSINEE